MYRVSTVSPRCTALRLGHGKDFRRPALGYRGIGGDTPLAGEDSQEQANTPPSPTRSGLPPEVAAILGVDADRAGDQGGTQFAFAGDMNGGQTAPAQSRPGKTEKDDSARNNPRYEIHTYTLQPTVYWRLSLCFAMWQNAQHNRERYGNLPDEVQFGVYLSQATWRDFLADMRARQHERYDPLGLVYEDLAACVDLAESAGEGEADQTEIKDAIRTYKGSLITTGRQMAKQGASLAQFLSIMDDGGSSE